MSSIFPIRGEKEARPEDTEVVELGTERAEVVLDALSSKTTREIFLHIIEDNSTISEISDKTDNSIQNVKYHVEKLQESNLIQESGRLYTENGNEMVIYAPENESLVLVASEEDTESAVKKAFKKTSIVALGATFIAFLMSRVTQLKTRIETSVEESNVMTADGISTQKVSSSSEIMTKSQEVISEVVLGPVSVSPETGLILLFLAGILVGVLLYSLSGLVDRNFR